MEHDAVAMAYHKARVADLISEAESHRLVQTLAAKERIHRREQRRSLMAAVLRGLSQARRAAREARQKAWNEALAPWKSPRPAA